MTDISALKAGLIADIEAADTLDALEALRVGAMGKSGVVTGLLKTLGPMSPEERLEKGPPIQDLRESVTAALADRKAPFTPTALNRETVPPRPAALSKVAWLPEAAPKSTRVTSAKRPGHFRCTSMA